MAHMPLPTSAPLKSPDAFRTISEVADDIGVAQHVLRFWETKFTQVKPLKRAGGRRYYRPEDIALLKRIHSLLYNEGYTIPGAQKILRGLSKAQIVEQLQQAAKNARPAASPQNPAVNAALPAVHKAAANQATQGTASGLSGAQRAQLQAVLADLLEMRQIIKVKKI